MPYGAALLSLSRGRVNVEQMMSIVSLGPPRAAQTVVDAGSLTELPHFGAVSIPCKPARSLCRVSYPGSPSLETKTDPRSGAVDQIGSC
jgi:hypothetical protein